MNYYQLLFYILLSLSIQAQDFSGEALQKLDDEELLSLFNEIDTDSLKAEKVARTYLDRARKVKDTIKMARGYDRLARIFSYQKNLQFADSIIFLTKELNHKTYPALGYTLKGVLHFRNKYYKKALDNFLTSYEYSVKNTNIINQIFVKKCIIDIKSIWGNPEEALLLSKEHFKFINKVDFVKLYNQSARKGYKLKPKEEIKEFHKEYLDALTLIIESYLNTKKIDSAYNTAKKGIEKSLEFDEMNKYYYLVSRSGEIEFHLGNYENAIDSLNKALTFHENNYYVMNDQYYIGLSYLYLGDEKKGIEYLLKADSIFDIIKKIDPNQSRMFFELYKFYKYKDEKEEQIEYLNKLIFADSIFKRNYQYIDSKIKDNYEVPRLIEEKEMLITSLKKKNKTKATTIWWVLGLLGVTLVVLSHYIKRQLVFKKRFNTLISQKKGSSIGIVERRYKSEISKEIINDILEHLDCFEREKKYLSQKVTLQHMAKSFGTNYNYLSKVINLNKGKRFSNYINDLRSNYAFYELKKNLKFRKYTIKAIAKECGFKSAESFSKSFYKNFRIYPSFYLKQLEKASN